MATGQYITHTKIPLHSPRISQPLTAVIFGISSQRGSNSADTVFYLELETAVTNIKLRKETVVSNLA